MAKKLDKTKPFGEIFGGGKKRFEQGGHAFDIRGMLVKDDLEDDLEDDLKDDLEDDLEEQPSLLDDQLSAQGTLV